MGKRHLLHVRSSQYNTPSELASGPKLPTKDDLEYGELAICYAESAETISLRNSNDDIVYLNIPKVKFDSENALHLVSINGVSGEPINHYEFIDIDGTNVTVASGHTYEEIIYPDPFSGIVSAYTISKNDTIDTAFKKVETTISALTQEVLDDEVVTERGIEALGTAAGTFTNGDEIKYIVNTNANYISAATNLAHADDILDARVYELQLALGNAGKVENISVNGVSGTVVNKIASVDVDAKNIKYNDSITVYDAISAISSSIASVSVSSPNKTINVDITGKQIDANIDNSTIVSASTGQLSVNKDAITSGISKFTVLNDIVSTQKTSGSTKYNDLKISGNSIAVSSAYTSVVYPEPFSGVATNVSGSDKIDVAFNSVEKTISALTQEVLNDEEVYASTIASLCNVLGNIVDPRTYQIKYIPYSTSSAIKDAKSINESILMIADGLYNLQESMKASFASLEDKIQRGFDSLCAKNTGLNNIDFKNV